MARFLGVVAASGDPRDGRYIDDFPSKPSLIEVDVQKGYLKEPDVLSFFSVHLQTVMRKYYKHGKDAMEMVCRYKQCVYTLYTLTMI